MIQLSTEVTAVITLHVSTAQTKISHLNVSLAYNDDIQKLHKQNHTLCVSASTVLLKKTHIVLSNNFLLYVYQYYMSTNFMTELCVNYTQLQEIIDSMTNYNVE